MSVLRRITNLFHRSKLDEEIEAELRSHIEMRTADNLAAGMPPQEARRDALLRFGNRGVMKERVTAADAHMFLDSVWQDLCYGLRTLRKSPGFTAVAVLTLALGIGANAAVFSILDPLLLRKLPVQNPNSLVFLGNAGLWRMARSVDYDTAIISELSAYRHYRDENRVFSGVLFFTGTEEYGLTRGDEAPSASGETVSENYFSVLGVRPYLGRLIAPQDGEGAAASPVAVLSYPYWQRAFASNPAMIGQTISLENTGWSFQPLQSHAYRIIGIAPPGFSGLEIGRNPDLYLPGPHSGDSSRLGKHLPLLTEGRGASLGYRGHI